MTNNAASQTTAQIQMTLAAGSYYLSVRNSGTGNPLSSTPTGYTPYGSIGQCRPSSASRPPSRSPVSRDTSEKSANESSKWPAGPPLPTA